MSEQKLIPTITVVEENPPEIDIITYYALLLGVPNILQAFIGIDGGEYRSGVFFDHGDAGLTMKNSPERIDGYKDNDGNLIILTDDNFEGDADNYYLDAEGFLNYFFPDIPFHPSDFTEFEWGLDFGNTSDLSLDVGNEINSITHMQGSSQAGTWSATGTKRPILLDGAAVFDGSNDELLASFAEDGATNDELFIVAKKPVGVLSYFLLSGRTWVTDGDSKLFGSNEEGKALFYNSNNSGAALGSVIGTLNYPDGEYQLWHWKNVGGTTTEHDVRVNGFLDVTSFIDTTQPGHWLSDHNGDPLSELAMGRQPKAGTQFYYPSSIKEILYFSNLDADKRKCIEVYLKYKHNIPVYDRN